jgi:PadR family transcriptional regulator PadR
MVPNGHVDVLLLAVVAGGPIHGYAIVEELRRRTAGAFDLPEGTIYPSLYRLERQGLLQSRIRTVDGRGRRVYRLTPAGRRAVIERKASWQKVAAGMSAVLDGVSP